MRFNKTERLGVIEANRIVTKDLGWIFRELDSVDVGIDALIEECVDGDPTGKFIALQIKSGLGNFSVSKDKLNYYISGIHYEYWTGLNIPIILVAHDPDTEQTYWTELSERTIKRTKKKWKIEIQKKHRLSEKSLKGLTSILSVESEDNPLVKILNGELSEESAYEILEQQGCIREAGECILRIVDLIKDLTSHSNNFRDRSKAFIDQGLSDSSPQVKAAINSFARDLSLSASRIESETKLYSSLFAKGFYAHEQVALMLYELTNQDKFIESAKKTFSVLPDAIDSALEGLDSMRNGIEGMPRRYKTIKEVRNQLIGVVDSLQLEYVTSKEITQGILRNLEQKRAIE
jgi:hypothetical protein